MSTAFTIIIQRDSEGNLIGSVPSLPGCRSQARTFSVLLARIRDAIDVYLKEHNELPAADGFIGIDRVIVGG